MSFDTCKLLSCKLCLIPQIEIVDMHFGTGLDSMNVSDLDPYILEEHLSEIEICSKVSRSVFFLVSFALVSRPPSIYAQYDKYACDVCVCVGCAFIK